MKKFAFAVGFLATATAFAASTDALSQLNDRIAGILAPFNNSVTKTQLVFQTLSTDAERALALEVSGRYHKFGQHNELGLRLNRFSYQYGDGSAPQSLVDLELQTDITKILDQNTLNAIIPELEGFLKQIVSETFRGMGDSISLSLDVQEKKQDGLGNYTTLKAKLKVDIDLSKLPAGKSSEDILATSAELDLSLDLKSGGRLVLNVISNPAYKQFRRDQMGLKETLEELLKENSSFVRGLEPTLRSLDEFATGIVEKQISE